MKRFRNLIMKFENLLSETSFIKLVKCAGFYNRLHLSYKIKQHE